MQVTRPCVRVKGARAWAGVKVEGGAGPWASYLMVIILSPFLSFCLSTSMCAPVTSWMAVMLQPPRPMMRETTEAGTESFLDLEMETLRNLTCECVKKKAAKQKIK